MTTKMQSIDIWRADEETFYRTEGDFPGKEQKRTKEQNLEKNKCTAGSETIKTFLLDKNILWLMINP